MTADNLRDHIDLILFIMLDLLKFMPRIGDGPVCQNCGLSFDPNEDPDCQHCHFNIQEPFKNDDFSRQDIEAEFEL